MNKICTSIEQSKKFIELGLDVKTADMYFEAITEGSREYMKITDWKLSVGSNISIEKNLFSFREGFIIPAWSLSALIELMPKSICIKQSEHNGYFYFLEWQFANDNSLRYVGHDGKCIIDIYSDHDVKWKDSIDTAFEMVCWLKENGKL